MAVAVVGVDIIAYELPTCCSKMLRRWMLQIKVTSRWTSPTGSGRRISLQCLDAPRVLLLSLGDGRPVMSSKMVRFVGAP